MSLRSKYLIIGFESDCTIFDLISTKSKPFYYNSSSIVSSLPLIKEFKIYLSSFKVEIPAGFEEFNINECRYSPNSFAIIAAFFYFSRGLETLINVISEMVDIPGWKLDNISKLISTIFNIAHVLPTNIMREPSKNFYKSLMYIAAKLKEGIGLTDESLKAFFCVIKRSLLLYEDKKEEMQKKLRY